MPVGVLTSPLLCCLGSTHPLLFVSTPLDAGMVKSLLIVHSRYIAYATVIASQTALIDYQAVASFYLYGPAVLSLFL